MQVRAVPVAQILDQAMPLFEAHWHEIARNKEVMVLDPDRETYELLDAAGMLVSLAAFDGDQIVGYCVSIFAQKHLHYAGMPYCTNDVLFVEQGHRGKAGALLMSETERIARERGAKLMLWHAKEGTALDVIMRRKRVPVQDIIYGVQL